jgi:hypothetical protein
MCPENEVINVLEYLTGGELRLSSSCFLEDAHLLLVIKSGKSLVGERVNTKSTKNGKGATRNHSLEFLIGGELKLSSMD